jgi:3-deoxy-D-manno-octulosonate 8-phosphate phosphatase (KDO 8-P phosphatase)
MEKHRITVLLVLDAAGRLVGALNSNDLMRGQGDLMRIRARIGPARSAGPPELLLRAQGMRVAFFDVDGVLTDGGLYFSAEGETLKRFHTLDGHGMKLLARAGITPCVISGRDSAPLRLRLRALGVTHLRLGTEDKLPAAEACWPSWGWTGRRPPPWATTGPTCRCCAAPPSPARRPTRPCRGARLAHHVTAARGGDGAAREFCDLLLVAGGHYRRLLEQQMGPAA